MLCLKNIYTSQVPVMRTKFKRPVQTPIIILLLTFSAQLFTFELKLNLRNTQKLI